MHVVIRKIDAQVGIPEEASSVLDGFVYEVLHFEGANDGRILPEHVANALDDAGRPMSFLFCSAQDFGPLRFVEVTELHHEADAREVVDDAREGLLDFVREHCGEVRGHASAVDQSELFATLAQGFGRVASRAFLGLNRKLSFLKKAVDAPMVCEEKREHECKYHERIAVALNRSGKRRVAKNS